MQKLALKLHLILWTLDMWLQVASSHLTVGSSSWNKVLSCKPLQGIEPESSWTKALRHNLWATPWHYKTWLFTKCLRYNHFLMRSLAGIFNLLTKKLGPWTIWHKKLPPWIKVFSLGWKWIPGWKGKPILWVAWPAALKIASLLGVFVFPCLRDEPTSLQAPPHGWFLWGSRQGWVLSFVAMVMWPKHLHGRPFLDRFSKWTIWIQSVSLDSRLRSHFITATCYK